jgi:glycolate oxidase FAD binding subunit
MIQPAAGVFHLRLSHDSAAAAVDGLRKVIGQEGRLVIARAPRAFKERLEVWGDPPPGLPLMRSIKNALDPNGILNPGRFLGGI